MLKREAVVRNFRSIKSAKNKCCIGKTKMHAVNDKQVIVTAISVT